MNDFAYKWEEALCKSYYNRSDEVTDFAAYDSLIAHVPNDAKDVLDVGAGNGYIVNKLIEKGMNAIGTTICYEDVEIYGLTYSDMHNLIFEDKSFDVVIARHVLEHALSPRLALREIWRVLRDNGTFLVETPINYEGVEYNNKTHFYYFMPKQYNNLLERNGFTIQSVGVVDSSYRIIAQKSVLVE